MPDLKPWRDVVKPHDDVAKGTYQQAEFAADMAQVLRGDAEAEYQDPEEFFQRTFITRGMRRLLSTALERVTKDGGEPIVKLKTTFGGGKTHTMLALYHLFSGTPAKRLRGVPDILAAAGLDEAPKANVAVLVGTALDPTQAKKHPRLNGGHVRTLWGEMAVQLGGEKAYEQVRKADEQGVAPGSDTLVDLLDEYGPAVILIDEFVAYARKLYGAKKSLTAGTFDNVMTFVQSLTEAVKRSGNGMIVASIPDSEVEIGEEGQGGHEALQRLEHTFGRLETTWTPVEADEGFHIVRRRLFEEIEDEEAREAVCQAFHKMYKQNEGDFPHDAGEPPYLESLRERYPIHPEVFDRLYEDWAALERFQKTRGVLRMMAAIIHELWEDKDAGLLIMPADFKLNKAAIRNQITNYIPEQWANVIAKDIDGGGSQARKIDEFKRLGQYHAARRVARTVFIGSAPSVKQQRNRGIEAVRVRLGCLQPNEPIAVYNDGLGRLMDNCHHLYADGQRFWFDLPPNLRRTIEEKAAGKEDHEAIIELERRLKNNRDREEFEAVHICPGSSGDVQDEPEARLVVLPPDKVHRSGSERPAETSAQEILENRGNTARKHRNMLIFLAPDEHKVKSCMKEIKRYLAWDEVNENKEGMGLDAHQINEAGRELDRANKSVDLHINESYCWLFVPYQPDPSGGIEWETKRLQGTHEGIVKRASKAVVTAEQLITRWSPALLKRELDHDKWDPWGGENHVNTGNLWEYLTSYLYLPRLKNREVLEKAIQEGVQAGSYFGYATSVSKEDRYEGLKLGHPSITVHFDDVAVLVKPEAAANQLQQERKQAPDVETPELLDGKSIGQGTEAGAKGALSGSPGSQRPAAAGADKRRFYGRRILKDAESAQGDFGKMIREVVRHLVAEDAELTISIEIKATQDRGFSEDTVHTVKENTDTLKFDQAEFVEE